MFVIIDATTGRHVRQATSAEIDTYWTRQPDTRCRKGDHTWTRPIILSARELVDHYHGPGLWFGGAGF